jgi:two-component system nitrate/nitrite response regulator NarL
MITLCIVEDHASLSDGLKIFLEQDGTMRVLACMASGHDMLAFMATKRPDIVITDISMPKMDGYEVCRRIKGGFPMVKVIALSMFDNEQNILEIIGCGASGYVLKSSSLTILKEAILTVKENKVYYDPNMVTERIFIDAQKQQRPALSRSERDILHLVAKGKLSLEISEIRGTALSTVHKHRKNIMHKLGLEGKGELYKYALNRHGANS